MTVPEYRLVAILTGDDRPPMEVDGRPVKDGCWERLYLDLHVPSGYTRVTVRLAPA